jgi:hypothetical protein
MDEQDIVYRLRKRAEIRRQIATRKSVQEGKSDRIADLLEEAANDIEWRRSCPQDPLLKETQMTALEIMERWSAGDWHTDPDGGTCNAIALAYNAGEAAGLKAGWHVYMPECAGPIMCACSDKGKK